MSISHERSLLIILHLLLVANKISLLLIHQVLFLLLKSKLSPVHVHFIDLRIKPNMLDIQMPYYRWVSKIRCPFPFKVPQFFEKPWKLKENHKQVLARRLKPLFEYFHRLWVLNDRIKNTLWDFQAVPVDEKVVLAVWCEQENKFLKVVDRPFEV